MLVNAHTLKVAPSFGNDRADTTASDSVYQLLRKLLRFVNNNAAEANIDGRGSSLEKCIEISWRQIGWMLSEEKSTDI
jgi:hypothetical protein